MLEINSNMFLNKHKRSAQIRSPLSKNLGNEYGKGNARVVKGDTVKILRGEYKNVEGKVERVNTERSTLIIEGVQKEIAKGGKVKVHIHSSNVMITSINTQDPRRKNTIQKMKKQNKNKVSNSKDKKKPNSEKESSKVKKSLRVDKIIKRQGRKSTTSNIQENNKDKTQKGT
ncbi:MAG: 50S ribosomal protein L24 [Nitrososphaeraceae archaeon]|nr:50S ribosomal protein L24 [Nitrososphaeraceae archaeon]